MSAWLRVLPYAVKQLVKLQPIVNRPSALRVRQVGQTIGLCRLSSSSELRGMTGSKNLRRSCVDTR